MAEQMGSNAFKDKIDPGSGNRTRIDRVVGDGIVLWMAFGIFAGLGSVAGSGLWWPITAHLTRL